MAGSIPPLVSSSPPPLCAFDDEEEEDDDEFGMYTAAGELDYNECISFKEKDGDKQGGCKPPGEQDSTSQDSATDSGLCPDSEGMSPTPHSDDERPLKQGACERLHAKSTDIPVLPVRLTTNCDSETSECAESSSVALDSAVHTGLTNGLDEAHHCSLAESDDDFGNFENFKFSDQGKIFKEKSEPNCVLEEEKNNSLVKTDEHYLDGDQIVDEFESDPNQTENFHALQELPNPDPVESNSSHKDKTCELSDFEQKHSFEVQNIPNESDEKHTIVNEQYQALNNSQLENDNEDEFDDFTDFKANCSNSVEFTETEPSERLSELSKPLSEPEQSEGTAKSLQVQQEESDDEFSNFADFSSSDCAFVSAQSSNSSENISQIPFKSYDDTDLRTESEFQPVVVQDWVSVFPSEVSEPVADGDAALLKDDDGVWTRLFPLETSPALSHQWADSLANRHLLSALNIDSRNILFMPWSNSAVPRFAANLSRGPLEPVKATEPLQPTPTRAPPLPPPPPPLLTSNTQESVPDAHFDWVSSGLTNPLDYPKPVLNPKKALSTEAENLLSSLPDISFMRKTYIDFPINDG